MIDMNVDQRWQFNQEMRLLSKFYRITSVEYEILMFYWKKEIIRDETGQIIEVKRVKDLSRSVPEEDQQFHKKNHDREAK